MIPVALAAEPENFHAEVRAPGVAFLQSLHSLNKVDFTNREYWRRAIPSMRENYNCICAYTCHWIAPDTGGNSADHFVPRKSDPNLAYEWSNLRLICSRLNSRKGVKIVVDPFAVAPGMFQLRFPSLHIAVGDNFSNIEILKETIDVLKLNDDLIITSREQYVSLFASEDVSINYLKMRAPFIYSEILRLGLDQQKLRDMKF